MPSALLPRPPARLTAFRRGLRSGAPGLAARARGLALALGLPLALAGGLSVGLAACTPSGAPSGPPTSAPADSLAWRIAEGAGGLAAWESLPVLRFDFAPQRDGAEAMRAKHLWDKETGRYRVEWPVGADSVVVALFNVRGFDPEAPEGTAALNGTPLDGEAARERLAQGYRRYINDTYWLLAPLKTLDPGVSRGLASDSAEAGTDVLALAFEGVGLTPGDRYWLRADAASGAVTGWTFLLQNDSTAARWAWTDPAEIATPRGTLRLPTRKVREGADRAILTEPQPAPALTDDLFTDPRPRL